MTDRERGEGKPGSGMSGSGMLGHAASGVGIPDGVTPWPSRDELLVLHAVRLAGFAETEAIADRAMLAADVVTGILDGLAARHLAERMAFADTGGWILTETGRSQIGTWLREEREASGSGPALEATLADFEAVNTRFVRVVTEWQLQSTAEQSGALVRMVRELTDLDGALAELMAPLIRLLPRFGRYPRQFSAALASARAGDPQWVAGVGQLSCHTVWAELHQDLFSSLGRDRSTGTGTGQAGS